MSNLVLKSFSCQRTSDGGSVYGRCPTGQGKDTESIGQLLQTNQVTNDDGCQGYIGS